jgi:transposase-like protein
MRKFKISPEVKEQIINRIKHDGVSVNDASKDHGVSIQSIYRWLGVGTHAPTYAELARLKKENKALLELVGEMTLKLSESKKKN